MDKIKNFFAKIKDALIKFKGLSIVYPTVIMFLICLVITAALSGTNQLTYKRIENLNIKNENEARARLISADKYDSKTIEFKSGKETEKHEYTIALKNNEIQGYIFTLSEKGYGGKIKVMVAVNTDGTVKAVEMVDVSTETPGLGQNTADKKFTSQFSGKSGKLEAVKNGTATEETQIDAVASATISSRAATNAVNKALEIYEKITQNESAETKAADKKE